MFVSTIGVPSWHPDRLFHDDDHHHDDKDDDDIGDNDADDGEE